MAVTADGDSLKIYPAAGKFVGAAVESNTEKGFVEKSELSVVSTLTANC